MFESIDDNYDNDDDDDDNDDDDKDDNDNDGEDEFYSDNHLRTPHLISCIKHNPKRITYF